MNGVRIRKHLNRLRLFPATRPLETFAIDIQGPLERSQDIYSETRDLEDHGRETIPSGQNGPLQEANTRLRAPNYPRIYRRDRIMRCVGLQVWHPVLAFIGPRSAI